MSGVTRGPGRHVRSSKLGKWPAMWGRGHPPSCARSSRWIGDASLADPHVGLAQRGRPAAMFAAARAADRVPHATSLEPQITTMPSPSQTSLPTAAVRSSAATPCRRTAAGPKNLSGVVALQAVRRGAPEIGGEDVRGGIAHKARQEDVVVLRRHDVLVRAAKRVDEVVRRNPCARPSHVRRRRPCRSSTCARTRGSTSPAA